MRGADRVEAHRLGRRAAVFILASALALPALAARIAPAHDLAREARSAAAAGVPLVVFFSQPDCEYCEQARHDYLEPLIADRASRARLRLVEVNIGDPAELVDFAGRRVSRVAFVRAQHVRLFPTLAFYGPGGRPVAEPLVGLTLPDFYQAYLDRRIDEARARLRAGALTAPPPGRAARATAGG
jgi:hypothetical protein